jgi:predicted transcriptional regulator
MAVEKLSVSVEPMLARRMRAAAEASGQSLSAFVADAVEQRLKLDAARQLLEEWEAEHGPVTEEERQRVRSRWPA